MTPWRECSVMDERMQLVSRRLAGETMAELCREFGISRKTGLQDLRSLPGMWSARAHRPESTALPLCESTPLPSGELHPEREARTLQLGCPQDSRASPAPILRDPHPGQEHHSCRPRSPRL